MTDILKNSTSTSKDSMKGRFLTFLIDQDVFGVEIEHVMEIVGIQPITEVPEMPDYINGIINLRGKIIPVLDVRTRFKKPRAEYDDRTCIIVIDYDRLSLGLIVDSVSDVLKIPDTDVVKKSEINSGSNGGCVKSIGKIDDQVILMIDCEKLLE